MLGAALAAIVLSAMLQQLSQERGWMGTANKNLNEPANGSYSGTWDQPVNSNTTTLDLALGGVQQMNLTGNVTTPIVLVNTYGGNFPSPSATASYLPQQIELSGTIGINTAIQVPATVGGVWVITNNTTGSFTATFGMVGSGVTVSLPQGSTTLVASDGASVYAVGPSRSSTFAVGDYKMSASSNAQSGWLLCYGQAVSRTTYAALYAALGGASSPYGQGDGSTTFNLPDGRGRAPVGADNMGGVAAGRLTGYSIGVAGGEQTHLLVTGEIPSHSHTAADAGHTHADAGHVHGGASFIGSGGYGISAGYNYHLSTSTATGYAAIQVGYASVSIGATGGGGAHNNIQPSIAGYLFIYAGV